MGTPLGLKYILYSCMDPLGKNIVDYDMMVSKEQHIQGQVEI